MKIYVVTTGERKKDYHILGATLNRKDAESYVNAMNEIMSGYGERFCIEEYDTDDFKHVVADHVPYLVELYEDGEHFVFRNDNDHSGMWAVSEYGTNAYRAKVYADCENNAVEVASKKIAEYKAREEGII